MHRPTACKEHRPAAASQPRRGNRPARKCTGQKSMSSSRCVGQAAQQPRRQIARHKSPRGMRHPRMHRRGTKPAPAGANEQVPDGSPIPSPCLTMTSARYMDGSSSSVSPSGQRLDLHFVQACYLRQERLQLGVFPPVKRGKPRGIKPPARPQDASADRAPQVIHDHTIIEKIKVLSSGPGRHRGRQSRLACHPRLNHAGQTIPNRGSTKGALRLLRGFLDFPVDHFPRQFAFDFGEPPLRFALLFTEHF